jgi:S-DNA-T family DNA segregation ATPase FtsK/SpoIIIE
MKQQKAEPQSRKRLVTGVALIAFGVFLLVSLITREPQEGPFPDFSARGSDGNAAGVVGAYLSAYTLALVGWTAYVMALLIAFAGVVVTFRLRIPELKIRSVGAALIVLAMLIGLAMFNASPASQPSAYRAGPGVGGGVVGILLAGVTYRAVGSTGTLILFLFCCWLGAFLAAGAEIAAHRGKAIWAAKGMRRALGWLGRHGETEEAVPAIRVVDEPAQGAPRVPVREKLELTVPVPAGVEEPQAAEEAEEDVIEEEAPSAEPEPAPPELEVVTRYTRPAEEPDDEEELELYEGPPREGGEYSLPPITLLNEFASPPVSEDESDIRDKGRILERTLSEFKVDARVVRVRRGPVITMYELSLAPGTKVSKVESLSDDLAIALKAPNVRIVAPLPGKNTVGIEVPNTERELVGVRELMEESGKKATDMAIPLFLGKDTAGNPLVLDLASCPHLMVAGATGSGKSVAINAMISSILMTRTPDQVQLLLVDPKSVEFSEYAQLPHLICPVLSDMKKAASVLKWACKKMDERYSVLSSVGERDIRGYNELGEEEIVRRLNPEGDAILDDVPFHMPHIVIIIDEFGELMMVAAKEVESSVIRLSQKARAVGLHLICATQRPSVDVITGLIKSNLPARIAFQVASKVDSRTILDRNGAELLLGRGDMLLLPPGTSRLVRAQGSYVSEEEIQRVVEFLEAQGSPQFRAELREYHAQQEGAEGSDELYDDAVRVVLETQRGSVSLLQRRLSVGYSRAARLIDMMAEAGIVGPYRGSQARRVLMTLQEWENAHVQSA